MEEQSKTNKHAGKCQYCGKESGNVKIHEARCEENPVNEKSPIKSPSPEPEITKASQSSQPSQPIRPPQPLQIRISDVQEIIDDGLRAWFSENGKRISRVPVKCGKVTIYDPNLDIVVEEYLSCLIQVASGRLYPPSVFAESFLGMLPMDFEFPEESHVSESQDTLSTEELLKELQEKTK